MSSEEDSYIGKRLREIRKRKNLSQKDVAKHLNISYQQVQQYEAGSTRIPASVLYRISSFMHVEPSYFFEGLEEMLREKVQSNTINASRTGPLHVVMLEDNIADEEIIREVCADMNVKLDVMRDADAFSQYVSNLPDVGEGQRCELILLDITLGRTDGIELLASLKRKRNACDIPVIVLTNSIDSEDVIRAYRAGAGGFIRKSPSLKDMESRVKEALQYWSHTILPSMQFVAVV